jgi:hypothetical protein
MPKWIFGRILSVLSTLILPVVGAGAQNTDSKAFLDEASAREYLRTNPTGPLAKAAFLAIVEFDLVRANPGFSRDEIIAGFNLVPVSGSAQTRAAALY